MSWYRIGTIALTNGSATVTGTGTQWILNAALGEALIAPDGRAYEITNIASNTSMTISPAYLGSTASGQAYAIAPIRGRIADLVEQTSSLLDTFADVRDGIGSGLFPNGTAATPALRASEDQDTGLFFPAANTLGFVTGGVSRLTISNTGILNALGAVGTPSYTFTGDTNTGMWSPAADTIAFSEGGVEAMRIDSSANVGIGTDSPSSRLHVNSSGNTFLRVSTTFANSTSTGVYIDQPGDAAVGRLQFQKSGASRGSIQYRHNASGAGEQLEFAVAGSNVYEGQLNETRFRTAGSERMRIDSGGRVGIGTTSPNVYGGRSLTVANGLAIAGSSRGWWLDGKISGDALAFGYRGSSDTTNVEVMRIDSSGNMGVGTSSPATKLDVAGGVLRSTAPSAFTQAITVRSDASATNWARLDFQNQNIAGEGLIYLDNAGTFNIRNNIAGQPIRFFFEANERMRITSAGDVGIGTSSPAYKLDVLGVMAAQGAYFTSITPADVGSLTSAITSRTGAGATNSALVAYHATTVSDRSIASFFSNVGATEAKVAEINTQGGAYFAGDVGIGTSSPIRKLEVSGDAGFTSDLFLGGNVRLNKSGGTLLYSTTGGDNVELRANNARSATATEIRLAGRGANDFITAFINDAERARIDSSGNLLVGTTSVIPGAAVAGIQVYSPSNVGRINYGKTTTGTQNAAVFYHNGTVVGSITYSDTATAYNTSSDARLKHDIVDAPDAASLIDAIKVRSFKWNIDDSEQRYGFVAQELVEVAPEAVSVPTDEDEMMGVDYSKLVPMLVKELQSVRARLAQLEGN